MSDEQLTAKLHIKPELKAAVPPFIERLWHRSVFVPFVPSLIVIAIANAAVAELMDEISPQDAASVIVYTSFGVICSQLGLLSIGIALGDQPFWRRMAIGSGLGLLLFACWWCGFAITAEFDGVNVRDLVKREAGQAICALPLIFLAAQAPLWLMRTAFGWRLLPGRAKDIHGQPVYPHPDEKLSLRDLFTATAVAAVSLSVLRLAPLETGSARFQTFVITLAISCLATATVSLVSTVPLLRLFFSLPLSLAWLGWLGYVTMVALVLLVVPLSGFMGMSLDSRELIGYFAAIYGFAVTLGSGATLLRVCRWQLQRGNG
ncbi:hypothetical protein NA78x_003757 [Anatilimnocola sp. NA78]|uniref:hypothetical protein n=1 Tax=Anatilimnocola sp. NA78 TaxID=3415683 RepID=UPI003CE4C40F